MPYSTYFVGVMFALEDILEAFDRWKFRETLPDDAHKKVSMIKLLSSSGAVLVVWSHWDMDDVGEVDVLLLQGT